MTGNITVLLEEASSMHLELGSCKRDLSWWRDRAGSLTNDVTSLSQCRQDRRRCGESAVLMYNTTVAYRDLAVRQIRSLARWTNAQQNQYRACDLDLALARQHQKQPTTLRSFFTWLVRGSNATAAAMSAVAGAGGPVSDLVQGLHIENRRLRSRVDTLEENNSRCQADREQDRITLQETYERNLTTALEQRDTAHA